MRVMAAGRPDLTVLRQRPDWLQMPYWLRLRLLRQAHGWTQLQLRDQVTPALEYDHVRALELEPGTEPARGGKRPRWRYPTQQAIETLAAALGVDPSEFLEYRLAKMRDLLDERVLAGGLAEAWENYLEIVTGLRLLATQSARELESTASIAERTEATDAEVRSLLEARRPQTG